MKQRLASCAGRVAIAAIACASVLLTPLTTFAQDGEKQVYDARLEGYQGSVTLDGGTALTWILFMALSAVCIGVLFKNANRTHLD